MKLVSQTVTVILTDDGKQVLNLASAGLSDSHSLVVSVVESEDLGIWVKIKRLNEMHYLLIRWEYILAIDLLRGEDQVIGLKG